VRGNARETSDSLPDHLSGFEILRVDLQKLSIEFERHFAMQGSQNACLNGKIFSDEIKSVFLRSVTKVRSEMGIEQEEATLLMDNCPSHLASDVMDMSLRQSCEW
jgi:hypothetical protein